MKQWLNSLVATKVGDHGEKKKTMRDYFKSADVEIKSNYLRGYYISECSNALILSDQICGYKTVCLNDFSGSKRTIRAIDLYRERENMIVNINS